MDVGEFERRLVGAIALGFSLGCGPAVSDDGGPASGDGSEAGGTSTTSADTTSSDPTTSASEADATTSVDPTSREPRYDLGDDLRFDLPPTTSTCLPEIPLAACEEEIEEGFELYTICVEPQGGQACAEVHEDTFLGETWSCLSPRCSGFPQNVVCEPVAQDDGSCCAWVVVEPGFSCPGRPFVVDDRARLPDVVERDDWSASLESTRPELGSEPRRILAEAWAREGCHEAASVASFSRFILQLLSLGAPASLVLRAQRAIAEEVRHAEVFFGFASDLAGRRLGPGTLPIAGALDDHTDPAAIAVSLANEGCIAETISAMQLAVAAERASDPATRAALQTIAEQELEHAELAWSALAWILQRGDARTRAAVAEAFAGAERAVPRAVDLGDTLDEATLRAHGRLGAHERLEIAQRALHHVVAPAADALLRRWTTPAAARRSA